MLLRSINVLDAARLELYHTSGLSPGRCHPPSPRRGLTVSIARTRRARFLRPYLRWQHILRPIFAFISNGDYRIRLFGNVVYLGVHIY